MSYKINCVICNKEFFSQTKTAKYCSITCKSVINKSRYRNKPGQADWNSIVEFINERDNYKCQKCGGDKKICVHHIKMLSHMGDNNPENLITLCYDCHIKEHKII